MSSTQKWILVLVALIFALNGTLDVIQKRYKFFASFYHQYADASLYGGDKADAVLFWRYDTWMGRYEKYLSGWQVSKHPPLGLGLKWAN